MIKILCTLAIAAAAVGVFGISTRAEEKTAAAVVPEALNFTVKDIDGKDVKLSMYSGKVIMILNVASKCGNTPQYKPLEALYEKYKEKGFVVLGFPANNFGGQEPGTDAQIKEFCSETYKVAFPMFSKISVKGEDIHPLYQYLTNLDTPPLGKGNVKWNFEKFLISKEGKVVGRFDNKMKPDDPVIVKAVETELAK